MGFHGLQLNIYSQASMKKSQSQISDKAITLITQWYWPERIIREIISIKNITQNFKNKFLI